MGSSLQGVDSERCDGTFGRLRHALPSHDGQSVGTCAVLASSLCCSAEGSMGLTLTSQVFCCERCVSGGA